MIISRTPLRISFVGGGTDFPEYYKKSYGAVVSMAIKQYVYIGFKPRFEDISRIVYAENEAVKDLNDIRHEVIREMLKFYNITPPIEVISMADIPGYGTGLGSSSALAVGLSKVLAPKMSDEWHAKAAYMIEHDTLKKPMGKQDAYASSYGGLNLIRFDDKKECGREIIKIKLSKNTLEELEQNLLCFYTGLRAPQNDVLSSQKANIPRRLLVLNRMRDQAEELADALGSGNLTTLGRLLHEAWILKKKLANAISNYEIDSLYKKARIVGALGGKICGSGGGGFMVLYVPKEKQPDVKELLKAYKFIPVKVDFEGSKIIYEG